MRVDVFLVVGPLRDPHIGDGQLQSGIGVGEDGDPFVGMDAAAVVHIGADVDGLHAQLREPVAQAAGHLAVEAPRCGLGVAAPEEDQLGVLDHVRDDVHGRLHLAYRLAAPDVFGAPVPPFPAVGVPDLERVAAQQAQELVETPVGTVDGLGLAVSVRLRQDGGRAVGVPDPQ